MNKKPLVSVIITVYNGEKYVKACLDNVFRQVYKNLEIIVVDDASTDNTAQIASQYPVKLIRHQRNRGVSVSRNTGIDASTGEYIHFMDVDDVINDDYYSPMVEAIVDNDADMACGGMIHQRMTYKTQLFKKQKVYTSTRDKLAVTYVGKWGYVWRYLLKKEFIVKYNLRFEEGRIIEDLPYSLAAVYYANKLVTVPNAFYLYVFNTSSLLTDKNEAKRAKRKEDKKYAKRRITDFAKEHGNFRIPGVNTGVAKYILRKFAIKLFGNPQTKLTEDRG